MPPLLEVQDLHLHYADSRSPVRAVDGISFALAESGTALGIVGESGCGKSSTANALMRQLPGNISLLKGHVRLEGDAVSDWSNARFHREVKWQRMALVPQGSMNTLNPVMRIGPQIIEPHLVKGGDKARLRERAEGLLTRVGLPASAYSLYPHELSGGMKQRVMIASALIFNPVLLIMDEPTSALDVSVQAQIMNLLKELKEEGLSIIFITHDIALASDICDRIAVIYAGRIAEQGTADQILRRPSHPYTQRLLASLPRLHSAAMPEFIPGAPPDLRSPPSGCRFHPRCPDVIDVCSRREPPDFSQEVGQEVWCWLREDSSAPSSSSVHSTEDAP